MRLFNFSICRALMATAIALLTGAATAEAKDRVAPTLPEAQTLVAGNSYYLYNAKTGSFVYSYSYGYPFISKNTATAVTIDNYNSNYSIKWNGGYFWFANGNYAGSQLSYSSSHDLSYTTLKFTKDDDNYTIQPIYGYKEAEYIGLSSETAEYLTVGNPLSDLSRWMLLPGDESTLRYIALRRLYNVLEKANATYPDELLASFDDIYERASATPEEIVTAAIELENSLSLSEYLNWESDYQILYTDDVEHPWQRNNYNKYIYTTYNSDWHFYNEPYTMTLNAILKVDDNTALRYNPRINYDGNGGNIQVYIDGELVRTIDGYSAYRNWDFTETLSAGVHTIKWVFNKTISNYSVDVYMYGVWAYKTEQVSVTTTTAGQLATEVLNFWPDTNHKISEVRSLKVRGPLNSQDFATIDMMTALFELDLSEADCKEIAANEFNRDTNYGGKSSKQYLYKLKLPQNLETIGEKAFRNSYIDEIELPATLKSIGVDAFMRSYIRKAIIPDGVTSIGHHAFYQCYALTEAHLPDSIAQLSENIFDGCHSLETCNLPTAITYVPDLLFNNCHKLNGLKLHEGLTYIGTSAFYGCYALENPGLPSTVHTVWPDAFRFCYSIDTLTLNKGMTIHEAAFESTRIRHLVVPEDCYIYNCAFCQNPSLESIELPTSYYTVTNNYRSIQTTDYYNRGYDSRYYSRYLSDFYSIIYNCSNLKTVTLKSPTMVAGSNYTSFLAGCGSPTIRVPRYLQNSAYRQDSYWYNYTVEGFSTADVDHWTINAPLTLNGSDRFEGGPDVTLNSTLAIYGDAAMSLASLDLSNGSMVLSECENLQVQDTVCQRISTTSNVWRYLSLPFNFRPGDIYTPNGAYSALYYYDGASRAQNNSASGNWRRLPADTTVTAGTGFIFQTSKDATTYFYALNDGDKQRVLGTDDFVKMLEFNDAESTANRGWNLVGNPYLCYYNLHKLNYTAPITVASSTWNDWYKRNDVSYQAYSIVDDDYAIRPREAFFVQCAATESSRMTFPTAGRQLTATITDQTGARMKNPQLRHLIDLTITDGDSLSDRTRVVLNARASVAYEPQCDASKFLSPDGLLPQLYTVGDDGTQYAINERPEAGGAIALGFVAPTEGYYTISITRNSRPDTPVMLYDTMTDTTTDLSCTDYTLHAAQGACEGRLLLFGSGVTGISTTEAEVHNSNKATLYNLQGRRTGDRPQRSGIYVVRRAGHAEKVILK